MQITKLGRLFVALLFLSICAQFVHAAPTGVDGLQHAGAIYFYAQPGTLDVKLWKFDSSDTPNELALTAILVGPDGEVFQRLKLFAVAGKPKQRVEGTLQASVKRAGVYTLLLSANSDQYLRKQTIGFSTNAAQYMISSAAGHADTAREEPITLNGPNQPFSIFFQPSHKAFAIRASLLPKSTKTLEVFDAKGQLVRTFEAAEGDAQTSFAAVEGARDGLWELRLPSQKGNVLIEGVNTVWDKTEKPLPVWTNSREHYFDLAATHWLLSPRRFARQVQPGAKGAISFKLFNNSTAPMPIELQLDAPPQLGKMSLSASRLELAPGASQKVEARYALPANAREGNADFTLVAKNTRNGKQAFALGELRVTRTPQENAPVSLPIQLKLFEHDQFQFAYEPEYSRLNQFYFDSNNRPWQAARDGLQTLIGNQWKTVTLPAPADGGDATVRSITSTIGADPEGNVYTVVARGDTPYLLRANAQTLQGEMVALPGGGAYVVQAFMGGKASAYPPAILRYQVLKDKERITFWSRVHHLQLFLPRIVNGKLQVGEPILISDNCVGFSGHSGMTSPVAADGDKLHFIWGETSDPKKNDPGVPTYTATYNRTTGALSKPIFLAYSPPVNDAHNMSTLLVDSRGERHVIIGSHGKPFQYLHAAAGSDAWSEPQTFSTLGQTYVGAMLDAQDGIHLFCRTWRRGEEFPGLMDAALYYQHKPKGKDWEPAKPFALADLPGYTVFYHRVTADRSGRLYLEFDYWPTWSPYRESSADAAKRPLYFTSADKGQNWTMVTTPQLAAGIARKK